MRKVKVIVEPADCGFSAYMADSGLDYSCIGEGTSTEETVEDFKRSYEGMRDYFKETGRPFEEVEFDFRFPSLQIPFRQIWNLSKQRSLQWRWTCN